MTLKSDCSLIDEETVLAYAEPANSGALEGFRILVVLKEEHVAALVRTACWSRFGSEVLHTLTIRQPVGEVLPPRGVPHQDVQRNNRENEKCAPPCHRMNPAQSQRVIDEQR